MPLARITFIGFIAGITLAGCSPSEPLYRLTPVTSYADSIACAKAAGKGAMVAALDAEGNVAEQWAPSCLTPVK